jgi:GPI mannosyltransferase 2
MLRVTARQKAPLHPTTITPWRGILLLVILFSLWKLVLLSIVAWAPGPGYDTSTTLLIDAGLQIGTAASVGNVATSLRGILKFVRWDAVYFSQIAQRGYLFEQEWAFGAGFPSLVALPQRRMYRLLSLTTCTD